MRILSMLVLTAFLGFSSNSFACDCDKEKGKHSCPKSCKDHKDGKSCEGGASCEAKDSTTTDTTKKK